MARPKAKRKGSGITLIVESGGAAAVGSRFDRGGGETHGLSDLFRRATTKTIPDDVIRKNLDKCMRQVEELVTNLKARAVAGWDLETVTVSLAVTAEGSIGVVTAGLETSIEASFKRTP